MRAARLALLVIAGCAGAFLILRAPARHRVELTTYLKDALGLRQGAPVQVAGVEVGKVSSVPARPEMREHPVEVRMALLSDYDLAIPGDSTVSVQTAGLLGETLVAINLQGPVGPGVKNGATLKGVEVTEPSAAH